MTLTFAEVWKRRESDFEEAYYQYYIWANLRRKREHKAAVIIQKTWRKHVLAIWLAFLNRQATIIQKVLRGFLARNHLRERLEQECDAALQQYYHDHATKIQKTWRGYWCRKTCFDYAQRKAYLKFVVDKSEDVRAQLQLYEANQRARWTQDRAAARARRGAAIVRRFHHMLGTAHTCGPMLAVHAQPRAWPHVSQHVHRPLSPTVARTWPKRYPEPAPAHPAMSPRSSSSSSLGAYRRRNSDDMVFRRLAPPPARLRLGAVETAVLRDAERALDATRHRAPGTETAQGGGERGGGGRGAHAPAGAVRRIDPCDPRHANQLPDRWKHGQVAGVGGL